MTVALILEIWNMMTFPVNVSMKTMKNIALDGDAAQLGEPYSSYGVSYTADIAIDGDLSLGQHTKTHDKPWWKVVLKRVANVYEVRLHRRKTHQGRYD